MAIRGRKIISLDEEGISHLNQELDKLYHEIGNENVVRGSLKMDRLKRSTVSVVVNMAETRAKHTLGETPSEIIIRMTSDGRVWESKDPDETFIYLKADADGRTCKVTCIG